MAPTPHGPLDVSGRDAVVAARLDTAVEVMAFSFAVKEVSLMDQGLNAKQHILQLEQEISLLSRLEHENIVQYFGTDKEGGKLYIFLELVTQGSLAALYQKYRLQDSERVALSTSAECSAQLLDNGKFDTYEPAFENQAS
ncbi:unnamed protein product [Miscanthus lutarioriparius]|uniref:Protein kinase domain-containing protein n=1 Tax=Miscanthus lutarioriparius TaxID=422564 RepID=A0A811PCL5_9POAL|nr:unnamed protein product [Miscanthus lutarioriparius]